MFLTMQCFIAGGVAQTSLMVSACELLLATFLRWFHACLLSA